MALNGREPRSKGRQANGVTASRCAGSYQLPPVAITHLQRLSTGFPLPPPGVISCFQRGATIHSPGFGPVRQGLAPAVFGRFKPFLGGQFGGAIENRDLCPQKTLYDGSC
jgi:hypothetical protein